MASFVVSTVTTAQQTLATAEVGYVTGGGAIIADSTSAVTMAGTARLTVLGEVASMRSLAVGLTAVSGGSLTVGASGTISAALGDNFAVSGSFGSNFLIRNAGHIMGGQGISLTSGTAGSRFLMTNSGVIEAAGLGPAAAIEMTILSDSTARVVNTGSILSAGAFILQNAIAVNGGGALNLSNSGEIVANSMAVFASGALTLTNTGHMIGTVQANGTADITNSGVIAGSVFLGVGNDTVNLSGVIEGDLALNGGNDTLVLTGGVVTGQIIDSSGNDIYIVDRSDVQIRDDIGTDTVISSANFRLISGIETLTLRGSGLTGVGSANADTLNGDTGSTLRGLGGADRINMGDGGGTAFGGAGNDSLFTGAGDDVVSAGIGDDVIFITAAGDDTVDGGAGNDFLSFATSVVSEPIVINLATGVGSITGKGTLQVSGIENVTGSIGDDVFTGNAADNLFFGGSGNDALTGAGGNDVLTGGAGSDTLAGGLGADVFDFNAIDDSAAGFATDLILAFQLSLDKIDLSGIDAVALGTDDAFVFIGNAAFSNGAVGEVRSFIDNATTVVEVDVGASFGSIMRIVLNSALTLTEAQFVL